MLCLNERNFLQLVAHAPNVTQGFTPAGISVNRQGGHRVISVAGMRGSWNNGTLDGVADTDPERVYPYPVHRRSRGRRSTSRLSAGPMTFEFLRNRDLGAKPLDFLAASPAKAPL